VARIKATMPIDLRIEAGQAQSAGLVLVALVSLPIWMNSGVI
jgi:hypothetical protein